MDVYHVTTYPHRRLRSRNSCSYPHVPTITENVTKKTLSKCGLELFGDVECTDWGILRETFESVHAGYQIPG